MGKIKELKFELENADITKEEYRGLYTVEQENSMMKQIYQEEDRKKTKELFQLIFLNLSLGFCLGVWTLIILNILFGA